MHAQYLVEKTFYSRNEYLKMRNRNVYDSELELFVVVTIYEFLLNYC